jgi:curved DNA-binding protein
MFSKNYYQILGVAPDADVAAIRKRYKELARLFHPDINPDKPQASERLKEINEARDALLDPEIRRNFDHWLEMLRQREAALKAAEQARRQAAERARSGGSGLFSSIIEEFLRADGPVDGRDEEASVRISLLEAYRGVQDVLGYEGKKLRVRIPPGIRDGQMLRFKGQGQPGQEGGKDGDLLVTVHISPDKRFERKGNDLHARIKTDLYSAVLGGKAALSHFKGRISVSIPAGSQPGERLRIQGLGMPHPDDPSLFGDLYVSLDVSIPKYLSEQERRLFEELARLRGGS